jgi:4-hydroxyphenylpyruvate dioxygenase-like putative hemolysin
MNSIKHIGLTVYEKDVKSFYEEILNFKSNNTFVLTQENAANIFNIPMATRVIAGACPEMELELFMLDDEEYNQKRAFNHICFFTHRIEELTTKAKQKGFKTIVLQHSGTLFIADSNQNIFEIKQLH